jgi:hypothetical protein
MDSEEAVPTVQENRRGHRSETPWRREVGLTTVPSGSQISTLPTGQQVIPIGMTVVTGPWTDPHDIRVARSIGS